MNNLPILSIFVVIKIELPKQKKLQQIFQKKFKFPLDIRGVMVYYKKRAKDTAHFARVAQWWSIALPRRGSRVRIPSRALF